MQFAADLQTQTLTVIMDLDLQIELSSAVGDVTLRQVLLGIKTQTNYN